MVFYAANLGNDDSRYNLESDLPFGGQSWQRLDHYRPRGAAENTPAVVFFYGGSWSSGKKEYYAFVANQLVQEGFQVVIPDYVKYPTAKYPAFVEDAALVTQWVSENLKTETVYLMGHSAGAHTAAMLISDAQFLEKVGLSPDFYRAFAGLAGPYDFVPQARKIKKIFGPKERYPLMQASRFIDGTEPPMFLMIAGEDSVVARSNTDKLARAIRNANGSVQVTTYESLGHAGLIGIFSETLESTEPVLEDLVRFFRKNQS